MWVWDREIAGWRVRTVSSRLDVWKPLVLFRSSDRPDLHHTSPGDDGWMGRNLAVPKHTSTYTLSAHRQTPHSILGLWRGSPLPLPTFPTTPVLSFPLPDSPGTVKSSELSRGMSDDYVKQSAKHTHWYGATHTSVRLVRCRLFFLVSCETSDTTLDPVSHLVS